MHRDRSAEEHRIAAKLPDDVDVRFGNRALVPRSIVERREHAFQLSGSLFVLPDGFVRHLRCVVVLFITLAQLRHLGGMRLVDCVVLRDCTVALLASRAELSGCSVVLLASRAALSAFIVALFASRAALSAFTVALLASRAALSGCSVALLASLTAVSGCTVALPASPAVLSAFTVARLASCAAPSAFIVALPASRAVLSTFTVALPASRAELSAFTVARLASCAVPSAFIVALPESCAVLSGFIVALLVFCAVLPRCRDAPTNCRALLSMSDAQRFPGSVVPPRGVALRLTTVDERYKRSFQPLSSSALRLQAFAEHSSTRALGFPGTAPSFTGLADRSSRNAPSLEDYAERSSRTAPSMPTRAERSKGGAEPSASRTQRLSSRAVRREGRARSVLWGAHRSSRYDAAHPSSTA